MHTYKSLQKQVYKDGEYAIIPLRMEDRHAILKWRNEQMYHLRQNEFLTNEKQDAYFKNVISKLFQEEKPSQILFSYLKDGCCIGYGGLVHINWIDRNAEISFIIDTNLEKEFFALHWTNFLNLIEQVALQINLHKIFTYAFDLRPQLYVALESSNYVREAILKEHCFFEGKYLDVLIHSKILKDTILRKATKADLCLTFQWVNNPEIRSFSYNQEKINKKDHKHWFYSKLEGSNCEYYILEEAGKVAGSIRFDIDDMNEAKISYLIDSNFMGKGLGTAILKQGIAFLEKNRPDVKKVFGYVLKENDASVRIFKKLNFDLIKESDSELKYEKRLI